MKHFTLWGLVVSCFLCHFCHLSSLEACKNPFYGSFLLNSTGCLDSHGRCEVLHPCCCNSCSAHGYKPSIKLKNISFSAMSGISNTRVENSLT
ncbi:hypothetical protein AMTRI_Chr13g118660 [Amborella trichopoda]